MLGTTTRLVSAIVMSSILFSMYNILRCHPISAATSKKAENRILGEASTEIASAVDFVDNYDEMSDDNGSGFDDDEIYQEVYADNRRAIVLVSMGDEASNATMVERFVWSARNIGKYTGWIVLITDAEIDRYSNLTVAAEPSTGNTVGFPSIKVKKTQYSDSNDLNKFMVLRTEEKRFKRITKFKEFRSENTMSFKIFKTYILEYASRDLRLGEIELFYYLDVDIVFGNPIRPVFTELEQRYDIGNLHRRSKKESVTPVEESKSAKIFFFEGNGRNQIQGGQIVLDRKHSQPCLARWRRLMQKYRKKKILNDQTSLTMMLDEQRARANNSNITEGKENECEIVLMKQNRSIIQFPELHDIKKFSSKRIKKYPPLIHFRNSANVMKNVKEENLQLYMRDILQFDEDQEDEHGILNKMRMKTGVKKQ